MQTGDPVIIGRVACFVLALGDLTLVLGRYSALRL